MPQQNLNLEQVKKMWQMVKASQNPQIALNQFAQKNPKIAEVIKMYNEAVAAGQDPEQLFYFLAKQRGVDPEIILSALR